MQSSRPRYVLIAETDNAPDGPQWRFVLHAVDSTQTIAACDCEPGADGERLALLALVRGLEAIDQPAEVSVVTRCASLVRGVNRGLDAWRVSAWRWERFGRTAPIRDADLWRRVDRALDFHTVSCRSWRSASADEPAPRATPREALVEGRPDSPAMVIVRSPRAGRRVRLAAAG